MPRKTQTDETPDNSTDTAVTAQTQLVSALVTAINATKPEVKKTAVNRVKNTPWSPPPGVPRSKMKRKFFHHALPLGSRVSNEEIDLLNQIRPGTYCDGYVKVNKRRDKGLDIDYPVKTAAQRLKLVNQFGVRTFKELLQRIVDEGANPKAFKTEEDE